MNNKSILSVANPMELSWEQINITAKVKTKKQPILKKIINNS